MTLTILNVVYVLLAIAMIGFILVQRGSGAQAGSGFGAGASATVFGARGAGNFLTRTTKWLAIGFFGISLGMGMLIAHGARVSKTAAQDIGVMSSEAAQPADATVPAAGDVPALPPADGATAPAATGDTPAAPAAATSTSETPAAPAATPAPTDATAPAQPEAPKGDAKP